MQQHGCGPLSLVVTLPQELLTREASRIFDLKTLMDSISVTSSLVLVGGLSPCGLQGGPTTDLSGPEAPLANPSAQQAGKGARKTSATCGPPSPASSASAALQSSLENRLRAALPETGSTMFALTWKEQVTPLRRRICALLARGHRTSGSGSTGWQTDSARMAWTTPSARDWKDTGPIKPRADGTERLDQLPRQAHLTHGATSPGSPAATAKQGQLNPAFSRWLMGYPREWCEAAIEAWHQMPTKARKGE